eukprot:gene7868-1075_t
MSVKTAHKRLPRGKIKAALKDRVDVVLYALDVKLQNGEKRKIFAAGHMDKKHMHLVGSCGTSNPGKAAVQKRVRINKGEKVVLLYRLEQPQLLEAYRSNFNAIDCADRLALGPDSIIEVWKTKNVHQRIFAATLAMCEQNAYQVLTMYRAHQFGDLSRDEWRRQLGAALVRFKEPVARAVPVVPTPTLDRKGDRSAMTLDAAISRSLETAASNTCMEESTHSGQIALHYLSGYL